MLNKITQYRPSGGLVLAGLFALAGLAWLQVAPAAAESSVAVPPAQKTLTNTGDGPQTAVLAGGCFWGMETVFEHVKGVTNVVDGYAGGKASTANYGDSSTGRTNQAESVRITYNPDQISYADLLRIYFSVAHDPTQVNRQGPDTGREYRSEIFALNADQARVAKAYIQQLGQAGVYDQPIATEVSRIQPSGFYKAESYHQNYAVRHPNSLYIRINDEPKVQALKQRFAQRYRQRPAKLAAAG